MSKFPVPISGEKIPHGWFANLVRFVNSLTLRGDGRYTMVSHNETGTTVTLTPAVKNAIERTGGTPGGSGANQDLSVSVSGNTATIGLSGSTATAEFVGTGAVTLSENIDGQIEVNVPGGTGGTVVFFPDYGSTPINVAANTIYQYGQDMWLIGSVGLYTDSSHGFPSSVYLKIYSESGSFIRDVILFEDSGMTSYNMNNGTSHSVSIPMTHGYQYKITTAGSIEFDLKIYYT